MSRSKWKGPYFTKKVKLGDNNKKQKNILYKNSEITPKLVGQTFEIYNGRNYLDISVSSDMLNHKFGEFVFTRGKFSFKKKNK